MNWNTFFKIALGAALATFIVRVAGRGTVVRTILDRSSRYRVPVVHPNDPRPRRADEKFDSDIAPGAPF